MAPYCRIDCVDKNGNARYSDSLSAKAEKTICDALGQLDLPIVKTITVVGRSNQEALDHDYEWIRSLKTGSLEDARLPGALQAFLALNSTKYALLIYSEGFVWEKFPSFLDEDLIKYGSSIYLLIADVKTGKLVYYNRSVPEEADPLSSRMILRRVLLLLEELNVGKQKQV